MKVLLVNPFYRPLEFSLGLPVVESAFGAIPPINLLYVAAALREAGAEVSILDGEALRATDGRLVDRIAEARPDVVGLTSTTFSYHQVLGIARKVRERISAVICIGGRHTGYFAREIAGEAAFDYVAVGEIEPMASDFVRLLSGDLPPERVPGLAWRDGSEVRLTPPLPPPEDLDALPLPARDLIDNARYFSLLSRWRNFTLLLSSRGCPCECSFCEVGHSVYRARSASRVVEEMEEANARFGICEFDICDSDFCLDRARVLEIADRVAGRFHFSGRARVNDLTVEVVRRLARGGCFRIHLGIESAVPSVLAAMGKQADLARLPEVARAARSAGLALVAYFMIGNPTETADQARQTVRFARSLPFPFVQFTRTFPLPNTALYERYVRETGDDFWRDYYQTARLNGPSRHVGTDLDVAWVNRLINRAYVRTYLRPAAAWRVLAYFGPARFFALTGMILRMLVSWLKQISAVPHP